MSPTSVLRISFCTRNRCSGLMQRGFSQSTATCRQSEGDKIDRNAEGSELTQFARLELNHRQPQDTLDCTS